MKHGFNLRPAVEAFGISLGVEAIVGLSLFGAIFWLLARAL